MKSFHHEQSLSSTRGTAQAAQGTARAAQGAAQAAQGTAQAAQGAALSNFYCVTDIHHGANDLPAIGAIVELS